MFSVTAVNRVHVEIARETSKHNTLWNGDASNAYGALYTLKWNPKSFSQGQFIIRVIATVSRQHLTFRVKLIRSPNFTVY